MITQQIEKYINTLKQQREAGLLVITNPQNFAEVKDVLIKNDFTEALDWKQIMKQLGNEQSTFICIDKEFTKENYDLFKQYSERGSMIQIMDTDTMNLQTVDFDAGKTKLVYMLTKEVLSKAEEIYSIRDKAGLMEVIA